jgi:hypothetical protein
MVSTTSLELGVRSNVFDITARTQHAGTTPACIRQALGRGPVVVQRDSISESMRPITRGLS